MKDISIFPITPYISQICTELKNSLSHTLVLTAETGAGKSTVLPVGLLENFSGKIIMTEPRRIAALGVANRVADLLDEECGQTAGYKVHLENKVSASTRLEVVTEAVLLRKIQENPDLQDVSVVVLDEFHERTVNTDLLLAFLKEALLFRDDLYVIVMSATIDAKKVSEYLGNSDNINGETQKIGENINGEAKNDFENCPVVSIPGRMFPVQVIYEDDKTPEQAVCEVINEFLEMKEKNAAEKKDVSKIINANRNESTGILVFLPGIKEIRACVSYLNEKYESEIQNGKIEVLMLHSSISLAEQKYVISGGNAGCSENAVRSGKESRIRVIVSSAIAETSLTVPGVSVVIDSGLARVNRMNVLNGMENLVTEKASEFSAEQRKGRAGREKAGKCIRLWNELDVRQKNLPPEILRVDLTQLVLECAERGIYSLETIQFIDMPSQKSWDYSVNLLEQMGMLKSDGHITQKGRGALKMGVHPRLAGIAFTGNFQLVLKYSQYADSSKQMQERFINDLQRRITKIKGQNFEAEAGINEKLSGNNIDVDFLNDDVYAKAFKNGNANFLVLAGFPDRLALKISGNGGEKAEYQFASGRKAILADTLHLNSKWIVCPDVLAGNSEGIIFNAEALDEKLVMQWLENKTVSKIQTAFIDGKVRKTEREMFGKIVLSEKILKSEPKDVCDAWINEITEKGFDAIPLNDKTKEFLSRVKFYWQQKDKRESDEDGKNSETTFESGKNLEEYIVEKCGEWLPPFCNGDGGFGGNARSAFCETVYNALYWFLDGAEVDKSVPNTLVLANGNKCKIKYERLTLPEDKSHFVVRPVIEIIIQRIFGCTQTPQILGMKILFRLLSPASRPLQITDDLENFWENSWPEICKEMKGRYPKHNWDFNKREN